MAIPLLVNLIVSTELYFRKLHNAYIYNTTKDYLATRY